jgi:hypothetical protein
MTYPLFSCNGHVLNDCHLLSTVFIGQFCSISGFWHAPAITPHEITRKWSFFLISHSLIGKHIAMQSGNQNGFTGTVEVCRPVFTAYCLANQLAGNYLPQYLHMCCFSLRHFRSFPCGAMADACQTPEILQNCRIHADESKWQSLKTCPLQENKG